MELFIGPWNQMANWSVEGMGGSFRFLQRFWNLTQEFNSKDATSEQTSADDLYRAVHAAIKKVSADLDSMGFNTAIATLMELLNDLYKIKKQDNFANREAWKFALETFAQLLAPFAPHITEELWHQLGNETSIHTSEWPVHNEKYLVSNTMTIVAQVSGKLRAQVQVPTDLPKDDIIAQVQAEANVQQAIAGKEIKKTIYVPGKLVNFVV